MTNITGIGKTYSVEEAINGMKNGTINVEKLKEQGKRAAELYRQDPDKFRRQAHCPLPPLTPAEKQQIEARLAVLKKVVK